MQWALPERLDREVQRRYPQADDIRQLVDEHAANPFGPHSLGLAKLLNVRRRQRRILAGPSPDRPVQPPPEAP
jgi:hypothetical protein